MAVIKDVARLANVSVGTVSKYINGIGTLKDDTRARVASAIAELRYIPSPLARSMRTGRTGALAVVVPSITNPFYAEAFDALRQAAADAGQTLLLYAAGDGNDRLESHLADITNRNVDGIILCFVDENPLIDAWLEQIQHTTPVVLMTWDTRNMRFPTVSVDVYEGMLQTARHILSLGRTRIAYVGGPVDDTISQHKHAGFLKALADASLPFDPAYAHHGDFSLKTGFIAANRLMVLPEPPDAIIAENDLLAIGCMKSLIRKGIRIPEEVAVAGFDDIPLAAMYEPALTTLALPVRTLGLEAVRLMGDALGGKTRRRQLVILDGELIVRHSTDRSAPIIMDI